MGTDLCRSEKRIEECKGDCNVIFIGDSITQNWDKNVWNKYYAQRKALNYGISSDRTQHVLFRLQYEPLKTLKPKVAVILIGTNNTDSSPDEIAAGVQAVIQATKADFPGVKIILLDILPTARKTELMSAANTLISKFSDEQTVFRLNLENEMPKVGDNWRGLWTDRLHLTAEGYTIWAETMEPLMSKLLDDTPIK